MSVRSWQCPEDHVTVIGTSPENAESGVRAHFDHRDHEHLVLAGFTDGGPVIQGWVPEGEGLPEVAG